MSRIMRSFFAFLAAPIPATILLPLILHVRPLLGTQAAVFAATYVILLGLQVMLGIPLRVTLARGERATLMAHVLIGSAMYGVPSIGIAIWVAVRMGRFFYLTPHVLIAPTSPTSYVIAGGVTGGLYWLLARIGTPGQRQRKRIAALDADFG
jgi:ethanolamine transporter EutH